METNFDLSYSIILFSRFKLRDFNLTRSANAEETSEIP